MSEDSSVAAPSSSSSGNDSGPEVGDGCISSLTHELPFSLGNPKIKETRGVMHFFREDAVPSFSKLPVERKPHICVLGVPNRMTYADFCQFCGSFIQNMQDMRAVRINDMDGHYSVLIKFDGLDSADDFYKCFNGQIFSSLEVETCHVLFVIDVLYTGSIEHACSSVLNSSEQPTCPECLEVLDQDSGVTLTTVCNHTFHCSCIPRWIDPSCPVCRYCQQQPEKSICFICQTSENLRMCMICGFVGCGSCCKYKEGHAITHWKETQHSYSLEVETLRVWDYVGDNYVHPFLAFRRSHQVKISDDSFAAAPSSSSSANDSGPKVGDVCLSSMTCELLFSSGNPTTEVARGIMHLFRDDVVSSVSKLPTAREPQICVLGVPNHMTFGEFCQLCGSFIPRIQEMRAVRISDMDGRYSVLIKFDGQDSTDDFYKRFNGQQFPSLEGETCRVLFMIPVPYMDYVDIDDPEARSFSRITATSSSQMSHQVKMSKNSFAATSSSPNDSGPKVGDRCLSRITQEIPFSLGNPTIKETRGVIHLFNDDVVSSVSELPVERKPLICVLGVPNRMTYADFCQFCGSFIQHMQEMRVVRINDVDGCYSVLIKFDGQDSTDDFYKCFNGQNYPLEGETCHVLFMVCVPYMDSIEHPCASVLNSSEQPTCAVCFDHDSGGIFTTICNHSFHCSCISRWSDSSCPVCRYCQQHQDMLIFEDPSSPKIDDSSAICLSSTSRWMDFKYIKDLGEGGYGSVSKCKNLVDQKFYAVKTISLGQKLPKSNDLKLREVYILSLMNHQHIIRYFQAWIEKTEENAFLYIQMEYCPGSLSSLLKEKIIDSALAWRIFHQILEAVIYIHEMGVVHRDLKPDNIFLDDNNDVKIGDFGLAKRVLENSVFPDSPKAIGSQFYMAPDFEKGRPEVDTYSLGVIFFELWYHGSDLDMLVALDGFAEGIIPDDWRAEFPKHALFLERLLRSDRPPPVHIHQLLSDIFGNEGQSPKPAIETQQKDGNIILQQKIEAEIRAQEAEIRAQEAERKYQELLLKVGGQKDK